jgi:hypothetical protein
LEGGIYQFTLAERFGPLDRDANGLREGARFYLIAASFYGLDWEQSVLYFQQVYAGYPGLWDGTNTVAERYYEALMRYGDQLANAGDPCGAVDQYTSAQALGGLDTTAQEGYERAYRECFPPTATTDPNLLITPTVAVETPIGVTTEPAPATTEPPPPATTEPPPPTDPPTEPPTQPPVVQ